MMKEIQGYTHTQTTASDTWVIAHNLNCKPVVQIYVMVDGKVQRMLPLSITADSTSQVTVKFSSARAGYAVLM